MKKALITGVTGQDGAYLAELLLGKGYEVHGIKRRSSLFNTGRIDHIYEDPHQPHQRFILHYGDMTDSSSLLHIMQKVQPDEVYNLAAQSHVQVSFEEPEYTANSDALGVLRILEAIRTVLLSGRAAPPGPAAEAALFAAARVDHLDALIRPSLAAGTTVVSDRFIDSTRVYQGAAGHVPFGLLRAIERVTIGPTRPDLTLMLDLPSDIGLARAAARRMAGEAPDRFESEALAFHDGLRQGFLRIAAAEPGRCAVVDASGSAEAVAAAIWALVETRLPATAVA